MKIGTSSIAYLLAPLLLAGCAHTPDSRQKVARVDCIYKMDGVGLSGPRALLTANGQNSGGEMCFVANMETLGRLFLAPRVDSETTVTCGTYMEDQQPLVLGTLYDDGFRIDAIERGSIEVNGAKIPLPEWKYTLIRGQK